MKKVILLLLGLMVFSACGQAPLMDELSDDGSYHYRNSGLGFVVALPPEFIYYQTQRKNTAEYIDIEFFVPTSDLDYSQTVPSYAQPLTVRVYTAPNWEELLTSLPNQDQFISCGAADDRAYVMRFWETVPVDWSERWNDQLKQRIIDSFEIK